MVEITITYTEKGEGTKTATATYAYNGVDLTSHYTELSIGLGVDNAWAKITDISTEEAEEAPAKGVVLGTDGNTIGYTPTVSRTAISAGEKIVLTGTMTAGSENAQGYTVALVGTGTDDGNGFPTYVFRPDHCINAPNAFPNAPTNTFDFGWTVTMSDVSDWSAFNAAKADCETTLTIDWTNKAQIVITEKFGDTQSITYTITATEGHALDNSYQVVLGADHCFTTFTSVVRTAAPAAAE